MVLIALALLTAAPNREADTLITLVCAMLSALELANVTLLEAAKVGALVPPVLAELWVRVRTELPTRFSTTPTPTAAPKPAATEVLMISELRVVAAEAEPIVNDPALNAADATLAWLAMATEPPARNGRLVVLAVIVSLLGFATTAAAI